MIKKIKKSLNKWHIKQYIKMFKIANPELDQVFWNKTYQKLYENGWQINAEDFMQLLCKAIVDCRIPFDLRGKK